LFKLRPLALETQGLIAALDQLAEKMEQTYKQPCTMRIHPDVQHYLDEAKQGAMFYLIEEAINNARKYAGASMITVQAVPKDQMITLTITDNGKGFDPDSINKSYSNRGSFGMVNMRERADMLDGILTIDSQKGQGTTIRVRIPIDTSKPTTATGSYRQVPTTKLAATAKSRLEEL
jgi:signal transduction histidine kinase